MELSNSLTAIVTGGASGLGLAAARALAAQGVRVAIFDLNETQGSAVAAELGGTFCRVDVTSDAEVEVGFTAARAALGQERILINCAGIGAGAKTATRDRKTGEIRQHPIDAFNRVLQINLVGSFRCAVKAAAGMLTLPPLPGGERGVIVHTASVAAEDGQIGQVAYSASKAGLVGLTLPMARDLASEGVRVNTIMPGIFDTPIMATLPDNVREALGASVPFPPRLGRVDEFASLALEMCRNAYFNGASVRLDGAIRMAPR
jgi:NAD(P)-dependent dehydrogenase (short-subunit alcohol dehydrogenase family)